VRRTLLRFLAIACGLGLAAVLALVLVVFVQYRRNDHPIALPRPRGPHPVGRVLVDWTDPARRRELMVFIWYPAQTGAAGRRAEYIPGKWGELEAQSMGPIPAKRLRELEVSAIENAPVAPGAMPVLVLLPGMGRIPAHYTTLAEDLASYGYLVAGVTPTGNARPVVFADGRVDEGVEDPDTLGLYDRAKGQQLLDTWGKDASFALSRVAGDARFAGRVKTDKAGIFGHSFGGISASHALRLDPRFARAANLDGSFDFGNSLGNLDKPLLILEGGDEIAPESKAVCDSDRAGCTARAFPKARHMNFSDAGVLPSRFPLPRFVLMLGDVDGAGFLYDVADLLRAFFDRM
jgi:dienelactone hydrolase